jgi:hypothetical protein
VDNRSRVARRFEWLSSVAALLAIVACYGTVLVVSALSLLGVTLAIHEGAWAGVIVLFAVLAAVGVALGYWRHRVLAPLVIAVVGAVIILWVMFGFYNRILELTGFAALIGAATWDWRLKGHRIEATPAPEQQRT